MKIICVEEHLTDPALTEATKPGQEAESPYMADWGSRVKGEDLSGDRPRQVSKQTSMKDAQDVGAGRLAKMDANGIDMQVLSYSNASQLVPAPQAIDLTRAANDKLAEVVRAHPTRFAGFATLPWQDPQAAAAELTRAVQELGFVGAMIQGHPGPTFLDDPQYEPVLAALNALKFPLYVHPGPPLPQVQQPYYGGLDKELSARLSLFGWGWHNEAGIQVIRLILSGAFEKFPQLQVISGHWGEMVPFWLPRMDDAMSQEVTRLSRTITDTYRQHVYVNPSGLLYPPQFKFIHEVLGADRILYAVDYPYLTMTGARRFLEEFPISDEDRAKIAHGNAERLFRLPA